MTMQNLKPFYVEDPAAPYEDAESLYIKGKGNYQREYEELLLTYFPEGRTDMLIGSTREFVFIYTWRIWHTYVTTKGRGLADIHLAYLTTVHHFVTTAETISFNDLLTVIQVTAEVIKVIYAMKHLWGKDGVKRMRPSLYRQDVYIMDKLMDIACWFCTCGPDKVLDNKEK